MPYWQVHVMMILGLCAIGAVVGSFLNVCIYRIPWEKSVIWPASHCPRCWSAIAPRDNIPILSWIALRGECRQCGLPIAMRYPLIEALVGLLFAAVYVVDVIHGREIPWGGLPPSVPIGLAYYLAFVALLVVATFIDYDLWIIPDQVTVPGMAIGLAVGCLWPEIRPNPSNATTHADGLWIGVIGLLAGGGLTWFVRVRRLDGNGSRGNGVRRRHPHGDDRRVSRLAGRRLDVFPRALFRTGARLRHAFEIPGEKACRSENFERRPRTPLWAVSQHGGVDIDAFLALALAGLGSKVTSRCCGR